MTSSYRLFRLFLTSSNCRNNQAFRKSIVSRQLSALTKHHYLIREDILELLEVRSFHEEELKKSFELLQVKGDDAKLDIDEQMCLWKQKDPNYFTTDKEVLVKQILLGSVEDDSTNDNGKKLLSFEEYKQNITKYGEALDPRVWTLGLSYLCTGLSVGIIVPCMPLLISQLHISATSFGAVISIFGLSKMLGNIPAAYCVERYGRKPTMIAGILLCGLTNGAVSLVFFPAFGVPWMIFCRFLGGFGVSGFMSGGQMILSDIATPLNRTRTFAPVMAGFSAGTALGPAVGGVLLSAIGLPNTYLTVGGIFGIVAGLIYTTMGETRRMSLIPNSTNNNALPAANANTINSNDNSNPLLSSFHLAYTSWRSLLQHESIQSLVALNSLYWFVYSGAQMTLLPLHMVHDAMQLSSAEIGMCFAYSSVVSLATANVFASLADRMVWGKYKVVALGTACISSSIFLLPLANSFEELLLYATPMALGATALNASPVALITEQCKALKEKPEQGLALYRTSGDLGLLFGAVSSGALAHAFSLQTAFHLDSAIMTAAMLWFVSKHRHKVFPKKDK